MTGTAVLSGAPSPFDCYVQFEGQALVMPSRAMASALNCSQTLRRHLHSMPTYWRYRLLIRSGGCARSTCRAAGAVVDDDRRPGRWRVVEVTHDLLAIMLGVRRPGVTTSLHELEGEGLIKSTRGKVAIVDRGALLVRAGNAYGKTERSYEALIDDVDPNLVTLKFGHRS